MSRNSPQAFVIGLGTLAAPIACSLLFATHETFLGIFPMNKDPTEMSHLFAHEAGCPELPHLELDGMNRHIMATACDDEGTRIPFGTVQLLSLITIQLLFLLVIPRWGPGKSLKLASACMFVIAFAPMFIPMHTVVPSLPTVPVSFWVASTCVLGSSKLMNVKLPRFLTPVFWALTIGAVLLYAPLNELVGVASLLPGAIFLILGVCISVVSVCTLLYSAIDRA